MTEPETVPEDRPTSFELGKIAALDEIKQKIILWLAWPITIIGLALGFGVFSSIGYLVERAVTSELGSQRELFADAAIDARRAVAEARELKTELESEVALLEGQVGALQDLLSDADVRLVFERLRFDLYHIRSLSVRTHLLFSEELKALPYISQILTIALKRDGKSIAEFHPESRRPTRMIPKEGIRASLLSRSHS